MKHLLMAVVLMASSAVDAPGQLTLPSLSVATTDDEFATRINPGGLGLERGSQFAYLQRYSGSKFDRDATILYAVSGIGFSIDFTRSGGTSYNRYTLARGFRISRWAYAGASYSWGKKSPRPGNFGMGILLRPSSFLSVGATGSFLDQPSGVDPAFDLGLALRPFGSRLTLAADVRLFKDRQRSPDYGDELEPTLRITLEPIDGVELQAHFSEDFMGGGLSLNLGHTRAGGYSHFSRKGDREHLGGSAILRFTKESLRTSLEPTKPKIVELKFSSEIKEENRGGGLFRSRVPTTHDYLDLIDRLKEDDRVDGVLLRVDQLPVGFSKVMEIRDALTEFKRSGKKVYAYFQSTDNRGYMLASVADQVFAHPAGYLLLNGLRMEFFFLKGTLDKLGIKASLEHIGEYKTASDVLTRESMSEAHREMANALLDDLDLHFVNTLAKGRGVHLDTMRAWIDRGPFTPSEALRWGLVDSLMHEDELREFLRKGLRQGKHDLLSMKAYKHDKPYGYEWALPPSEKIAVIYATGAIISGPSESNLFSGETMGSETIAGAIRKAREDKSVKSIVLRVDSPGGSGFASDVIWREVVRTTTGKERKPFIVSMSSVAGSGGYYIACAADTIVAMPSTLTGSIGVISGKFDFSGLYEKLGVKLEAIKRGEHAGMYDETHDFSEEEREIVARQIREFYTQFVAKVAEGRGLRKTWVDSVGQGRVWTGAQARDIGLVDELGGLQKAIEIAKSAAGIDAAEEVSIVTLPRYKFRLFGLETRMMSRVMGEFPPEVVDALSVLDRYALLERENMLYVMPMKIVVE